MRTKLLVTGSTGQLGKEFCVLGSSAYEIIGVGRNEADITCLKEVRAVVEKHKPDIVIHTAAISDVDACEEKPELAIRVNTEGARNIAGAAEKVHAAVIFFSTDYVFDGNTDSAYFENDSTKPISKYGRSKLDGEKATIEFNKNWTIIRTSWVYSANGKNFVKSILAQAHSGKPLKVVSDQFGSPTWTKDIVNQTIKIIESKQTGLFHVASKGEVSRYEFAQQILDKMQLDVPIELVSTDHMPRLAKRPARSSLASERLGQLGIDVMRSYEVALDEFLNEYGEKLLNEIKN